MYVERMQRHLHLLSAIVENKQTSTWHVSHAVWTGVKFSDVCVNHVCAHIQVGMQIGGRVSHRLVAFSFLMIGSCHRLAYQCIFVSAALFEEIVLRFNLQQVTKWSSSSGSLLEAVRFDRRGRISPRHFVTSRNFHALSRPA